MSLLFFSVSHATEDAQQPISQLPPQHPVWLLVDTQAMKLEVKQGEKTLEVFEDIAVGRGGVGNKQFRGDDVTPRGTYRIGWINEKSPFRRFYGIDYPNRDDVQKAYDDGLITEQDYKRLMDALREKRVPPQNTPMGGHLGIHGLGGADAKIHRAMNWTHGCIALTNKQIDRLDRWITTGTVVKIK